MLRLGKAAAAWAVLALALTGCWDIKDIETTNFATAIGLDYAGGKYSVYVQMLDFTSVAKSESGKPAEPVPVWVGKGTGETLIEAFNDLYPTAQLRILYGQTQAIVLSERILEHGKRDAKDILNRYYEMRYTPWMYGTKAPIDELFAVTPFFNLSPIVSVLIQPRESYRQLSVIPPVQMVRFASEFREPAHTVILPSLAISKKNWKSGGTPKPLLEIDGCFAFHDQKYIGWFDKREVTGIRWTSKFTRRSPVLVRSGGNPQASVSLEHPRIRVQPRVKGNKVSYRYRVRLVGYVSEVLQPIPESELIRKIEEAVRAELRQTFETGLKQGADLLHLEHELYRQNNRAWKRIRSAEATGLTAGSLEDIRVDVFLKHAGKLKYSFRAGSF
ncbi:Ger(x)C family spore germination protein [Cohnella caldifontis]|uniref:Ger(x)C family spore germination protein n=1 Tax=Cohnella caldifontis TaxID=3027471 RepID=UPI0023EAA4F9|nr:Ger(x)C family spore germination protein [Cohnella sp. YIM B05605]